MRNPVLYFFRNPALAFRRDKLRENDFIATAEFF